MAERQPYFRRRIPTNKELSAMLYEWSLRHNLQIGFLPCTRGKGTFTPNWDVVWTLDQIVVDDWMLISEASEYISKHDFKPDRTLIATKLRAKAFQVLKETVPEELQIALLPIFRKPSGRRKDKAKITYTVEVINLNDRHQDDFDELLHVKAEPDDKRNKENDKEEHSKDSQPEREDGSGIFVRPDEGPVAKPKRRGRRR